MHSETFGLWQTRKKDLRKILKNLKLLGIIQIFWHFGFIFWPNTSAQEGNKRKYFLSAFSWSFFPVQRDNISVSFKFNTIIGWFQAPGTIKFWKVSLWFPLYTHCTHAIQKCFYGSNMFVPMIFLMNVLTCLALEIKSLKCVCLECTTRRYWAYLSFEFLEKKVGAIVIVDILAFRLISDSTDLLHLITFSI